MSKERMREVLSEPLTPELLAKRANEGWRPVAVEWRRESSAGEGSSRIEVPFGLKVAEGGEYLAEHPEETAVLRRILAQIIEDRPLSEVAELLNADGDLQRDGSPWNQSAVFELLPRVIEVAPSIYASEAWQRERAEQRLKAV